MKDLFMDLFEVEKSPSKEEIERKLYNDNGENYSSLSKEEENYSKESNVIYVDFVNKIRLK